MTDSASALVRPTGLTDVDDAELIVRVRRREPEAFRVLYERHRDAVSRYAYQCARGTAEAEDYVAEAFARVLQQLHEGRGPSTTFRAYVFTVVRNLAADRGRRSAREDIVADLPEEDHQDEMTQRIERAYIRRAFENLPVRWQRVLWLSEVEGCKPAEMAPILEVNANAAAALAYRAREGLRQAYLLVHLGSDTPPECRRTVDRLPAYIRSALPPASAERVDDHLEDCASCRARRYEITELDRNLRGLLLPLLLGGTAPAAGGPSAAISAAVSRQWRRLREQSGNPVAVAVAAGLAVVAAGIFASLSAGQSSNGSTPPAVAIATRPATSPPAAPQSPARSSKRPSPPGAVPGSPPVAGDNERPAPRTSKPEAAARPPAPPTGNTSAPTPPSPSPPQPPMATPSPQPPADSCVELLVVKICGP